MTLELISIDMEKMQDVDPDFSYLEEEHYKGCTEKEIELCKAKNNERLEDLNNGLWSFIGIRAKAEIRINGISQEITSAGVWGIESDSDESYFDEIYQEELCELKSMLLELGFKKEAVQE